MLACYIVQAAGLSQFLKPPFMQLQFVCLSVRKLIPSAPSFSVAFTHTTQQDWCPPTSFAHQPCSCHLHQAHFLPYLASLKTQMRLCNPPSSFVPQPLVFPSNAKNQKQACTEPRRCARPLCILHRSSPVASYRRNSSSPTFSQLAVGSRAQLRKHSVELRVSSFFSNAGSRLFSLFFFWLTLVYGYGILTSYAVYCINL
jgi:hypothetical protein